MMLQKRPITEHQREYMRLYLRRYMKAHPDRRKAKDAKYDSTHREHRNRHYREKWENDPQLRVKRSRYFKQLRSNGTMNIYWQRHILKTRIKGKKMHMSTRLINYVEKTLDLVNPDDLKGATDIRYWEDIRLRLEAITLLAKAWNKEYKNMGGKE